MTKRIRYTALAAALAWAASAAAANDLAFVYQLAKDRDPILREAEALYMAAKEAKPQAWAAYLPQITAFMSETSSDDTNQGQFYNPVSTNFDPFSEDTATDQSFTQIELRQTVFNWSKFKNIRSGSAAAAQAEAEYQYALQQFVIRVSDRYFGQLSAADTLEAARLNREAIGRQLEQAKKRFEVGLIAVTDVQESQAAFDQATADEIAAERAYESSREILRESTGDYVDDLVRPSEGMPLIDPNPATPAEWVKLAMDQNLNLIASRLASESAAHSLGAAWGAHYPTLDFVARRSEFSSDTTGVRDTSTTVNTSADGDTSLVALQLSIPLFAGGATQSGVRQARYRSDAADQRLERVTRETQRTASDALLGVTSEISRTKALRQAAQSSATALRATEAGFEVGTRTTVDVLDARRNLLRAEVAYRRAKYDYLLNTLRLKQAAGTLVEPDVATVNNWLTAPAPVAETPAKAETPKK
jgi:outer membrane protein